MNDECGKLLTLEQVAEQLQLSTRTIRNYIKEGRLPAVRFERAIRIKPEDLKKFIDEHTTE